MKLGADDPEQGEFNLDGGELDPADERAAGASEGEPAKEPEPPDRLTALERQLEEERERRIRLEERLSARQEPPPPPAKAPEPVEFSRAQLREAVAEGKINEDQMEEIWAKQVEDRAQRKAERTFEERERASQAKTTIETETQQYMELHPELRDQKSETWLKVKREYDYLIRLGDAHNSATELKAMRMALGRPTRIRERTASHRETSSETSVPSGQGARGDRPVDIWNRVPQKYREYYKSRVANGQMTLEDVKKDIPYMEQRAS